ncbi:Ig-like domain-containing protein [Mycolicibacterium fluoranthenivorans]|uniref:VCBS repeat-containing protein/40-residue YVTN family beta-propeller repeat-containing protein n=1 Tax=Mycolicibacterium fluoranthenivorans TaxID=258505 RepID=A0A1G4WZK4_9MYCO|nr:Ig-like domain-containing protein [Mycolicibacterium fluoranthenivorans]SCX32945.1 VCBS repeat-containing protein/40-residue YVTN family beta-propeller repeat-containing protein [Mycolicibacterium fluoranthenivorans]
MQLRYGKHVGRVGALAVALGIGSAIGVPVGIASATPDDSTVSAPADTGATTGSGSTGSSGSGGSTPAGAAATTTPTTTGEPTGSVTEEVAPGAVVSGSGGAHARADDSVPTPKPTPKPKAKKKQTPTPRPAVAESAKVTSRSVAQASTGGSAAENEPPSTARVAAAVAQQAVTEAPAALAVTRPVVPNPIQTFGTLVSGIAHQVASSFLGALRGALADSPLGWVMLGAARREVGTTEDATTEVAARAMAATQTVAAANQPPTASVTWGRPDATTGTVLGKLTTSDPEGKAVTVGLGNAPATGTLTYNAKTATLTYTPTTAQRFNVSATPTDDTVGMTLTVTDGVNTVAVPVNIPVSPSPFYTAATVTNITDPSAVVTSGTRAYVADRSTGKVTVFDTTTNTVITTFAAGTGPDGLAVKADGTRLYVASSTGNTVTVIDTKTNTVKATVAVTNPTALTINPGGSTVYVANGDTGTVTKISTSTNKTAGTVALAGGLTPGELAVSADGKTIFVVSAKATGGGTISSFSSTGSVATSIADIGGTPVGLAVDSVYKLVYVADASGGLTVVDLGAHTTGTLDLGQPLSGIALTKDRSALMVTTSTGLVAALRTSDGAVVGVADSGVAATSAQSGTVLTPDGTQMWVTDPLNGTVRVVSLVPQNKAPFLNDPVAAVSNPATGALAGRVGVVDFDGDPLTYAVTAKPAKGTLVLNADGTYTYTPTAAARHAAAVPGAPDSVTKDSFTVTVSDGRYGTMTTTVALAIAPENKIPTVTTTIGNPNASTSVVKGTIATADGNKDKLTYTVSGQPAKGTVGVTTAGAFTYTPTAAARTAALAPGASHDQKMDTFTVTVDDGHGGVVPVTVNVKIGAANVKPGGAKAVIAETNPRSGLVTGSVTATDSDGDTLTYTAGKTTKGAVVVDADGSFTYTPTAAARLAASKAGASAATKTETVTFTIGDGFGGTTTTSVKVSIAPNPTTNNAPTNGQAAVDDTSSAIGTVTGTVTAGDPDGDTLTYSLGSGPAFGAATVTSDGKFTYTPDVDARYRALVTPGDDTDTFTVTVTDAFGATTTATVGVTIAPPSATAVDQRPTEIAVNAQQMYFYSQTDTDKAMGLLKDAGITTIRIMLPWAGIEPADGTYDWAAVDRVVDSAQSNGITVLGVLGTTPDWAAVPGQAQYQGRPADLDAFAEFVTEVATHFQGRVSDYEVWNEPNAGIFWAPAPDAAQYTALLKVAYTAIKGADPDAVVIAASVGAGPEDPGVAINPVTFLAQMYAAGAGGYFDAVSFHPYQYALLFSVGEGHAGTPITQAEQMYAVMVANGDGNKKIWATEYGEPTSDVSETAQAAYIGDFLRTWRTLEFAGPAFLHTFADYPDPDPTQASFGLFRQDWTPKPAVSTVEQVIAENQAIEAAAQASVL